MEWLRLSGSKRPNVSTEDVEAWTTVKRLKGCVMDVWEDVMLRMCCGMMWMRGMDDVTDVPSESRTPSEMHMHASGPSPNKPRKSSTKPIP
eukprot:685198-Amorphochlora_amoeboformis.AAC.1